MAGRKGHKGQIKADVAERQRLAFEYRKAGASFAQIGRNLNISHEQARIDVNKVIAALNAESQDMAKEYRTTMLERLDAMLLGVWSQASKGHLSAIDRVLRIEERRAKLLGLDAPQKFQHEDWRSQAVADIRAGAITFDSLARVFDEDLATELFRLAGVPVEL